MRNTEALKNEKLEAKLYSGITSTPDFPVEGVTFRDLSPIWKDSELCRETIVGLAARVENEMLGGADAVVGIESRGFILGMPLSLHWNIPFVPFRKPGKLPGTLYSEEYKLEYGLATLQCQASCLKPGMRVIIHDDVLATGGTARAAQKLVEQAGAEVVAFAFIIELPLLKGRDLLNSIVHSMVKF